MRFTVYLCDTSCEVAWEACQDADLGGIQLATAAGNAKRYCEAFMTDVDGERTKSQNPPPPIMDIKVVAQGERSCYNGLLKSLPAPSFSSGAGRKSAMTAVVQTAVLALVLLVMMTVVAVV